MNIYKYFQGKHKLHKLQYDHFKKPNKNYDFLWIFSIFSRSWWGKTVVKWMSNHTLGYLQSFKYFIHVRIYFLFEFYLLYIDFIIFCDCLKKFKSLKTNFAYTINITDVGFVGWLSSRFSFFYFLTLVHSTCQTLRKG